jgi:hypothetical protein
MADAKQTFLEGITKENFTNWLHNDAFIAYASSSGKNGLVELGVDGRGNYAIRLRHKTGIDTHFYKNADRAVKAFKYFINN